MAPSPLEMKRINPQVLWDQDAAEEVEAKARRNRGTFASKIENAWIVSAVLVLIGAAYEWHAIRTRGFALDFNGFIFWALILGLALHGTPIRYVQAFSAGAKVIGPILLQFPIYGGIMGIIVQSGLGDLISGKIVAFATSTTLPFWSFISSCIVSLFVPSGGGQWAVQGPVVVSAALKLQGDPAMAAMGSAMGAQAASMIQPFWALPVLTLARLGIRDIMGYCVIAMTIGSLIYCSALLLAGADLVGITWR
jgi:short-chain fatty acids transporter